MPQNVHQTTLYIENPQLLGISLQQRIGIGYLVVSGILWFDFWWYESDYALSRNYMYVCVAACVSMWVCRYTCVRACTCVWAYEYMSKLSIQVNNFEYMTVSVSVWLYWYMWAHERASECVSMWMSVKRCEFARVWMSKFVWGCNWASMGVYE